MAPLTYKDAGVDMDKGDEFADSIYALMQRTFDGRVVENRGGFAALFSLDFDRKLWRRGYRHPLLVASTDGVGTKLKIAFMTGRHNTVGIDLVAMCVNDVLVQGAEPLFFLDYLAAAKVDKETFYQVIAGIAEGCRMCDCALVGGETAEMPGFYAPGEYDMAGFVVGVVERRKLVTGRKIERGDQVIGLASSGLHSNGYSLARKVFFDKQGMRCDQSLEPFGIRRTLGEELLTPTRIYVRSIRELLHDYRVKQIVCGMAHVTGGGLPGNVVRILPPGCAIEVRHDSWPRPPIFDVIRKLGDVPEDEMYRTFNMGIGYVLVVPPYFAHSVMHKLERLGEKPWLIGRVVEGEPDVRIV